MKLDLLVLAAHPDDAEIACGGTILSHIAQGKKVGVVDFTSGEMGTRGTPETRKAEAHKSSAILGLSAREILGLRDVFFQNDEACQLEVIKYIRLYQPEVVLCNAISDRHPDHGKGSRLASDACFMAGLSKIQTVHNGLVQTAWRPKVVFHYIQDQYINPDFIVDVSAFWGKKMEAIRAYKTQFYDPQSTEPTTYISTPDFLEFLDARGKEFGHAIGAKYGEGFTKERHLGIKNIFDLI